MWISVCVCVCCFLTLFFCNPSEIWVKWPRHLRDNYRKHLCISGWRIFFWTVVWRIVFFAKLNIKMGESVNHMEIQPWIIRQESDLWFFCRWKQPPLFPLNVVNQKGNLSSKMAWTKIGLVNLDILLNVEYPSKSLHSNWCLEYYRIPSGLMGLVYLL